MPSDLRCVSSTQCCVKAHHTAHQCDWKTLTSLAPAVAGVVQTPPEEQRFFLSVWPHSRAQSSISCGLHTEPQITLGLWVWKLDYEVATEHYTSHLPRSKVRYLRLWHLSHMLWKYPLGILLATIVFTESEL